MVKIMLSKQIENIEGEDELERIEFDAKVFIFDKDGTLLSHNHFVPIMKKRIELFSEHYRLSPEHQEQLTRILGLDPVSDEIITHGTMFIARADTQLLVEAFLNELGFRGLEVKSTVTKIFHQADEQVELERFLQPLPGIPGLLAALKAHGAHIAIATHDSTAAAKKQLTIAQLEQYIDIIIGLDYSDQIRHKPSPSMVIAACEKFKTDPGSVVVFGDAKHDVLMGKAGGAGLAVAVLSGEDQAEDFTDADAIISSLAELEILE